MHASALEHCAGISKQRTESRGKREEGERAGASGTAPEVLVAGQRLPELHAAPGADLPVCWPCPAPRSTVCTCWLGLIKIGCLGDLYNGPNLSCARSVLLLAHCLLKLAEADFSDKWPRL